MAKFIENKYEKEAKEFTDALITLVDNEDNLYNFESYLSNHFDTWLTKYASTPEDIISEIKHFANM